MSKQKELKPFPVLSSDKAAQDFVEGADLSVYDFSEFRPLSSFSLAQKNNARLEMRISESGLNRLKSKAKALGVPHSRLARMMIEQGLNQLP